MYDLFSYEDIEIDRKVSECNDAKRIRKCEACGKLFVSNKTRRKFCNRIHYRICPCCNKPYNVDLSVGIKLINKTCSSECSKILLRESMLQYNAEHPKPKRDKAEEYETCVCKICGKEFQVKKGNKRQFCSSECKRQGRRQTFQSKTRKCRLCGKEFHPVNTRNWYCEGPHYTQCIICGKDIEITTPSDAKGLTCSEECKRILRQRTSVRRYTVEI